MIVHNAVNGVLANAPLSDQVAKAVLKALEAHEDELFFKIVEKTGESERADIESIRDFLKS